MRAPIRVGLVLLLGLGIIFSTPRLWLPLPGLFLLLKEDPQKADCIVVLRGDDYYRIEKAVELVKDGYSNEIITSLVLEEPYLAYADILHQLYGLGSIPQKDLLLKYFNYFGKNPEGIHFTDQPVTSTFDEAKATKVLMDAEGFNSMILVTNPYHMRRAKFIFDRVFKGTGIVIYTVAAPNPFDDPEHWWRTERDVKQVAMEYLSFFHNILYRFILDKDRTSFDTV